MLQVLDQMMLDMFLRPFLNTTTTTKALLLLLLLKRCYEVPPKPSTRPRRRLARFAGHDGARERRAEATDTETTIVASALQPEGTTSASTTKVKRKGGVRKPNHYPNAKMIYVIDEAGEEG